MHGEHFRYSFTFQCLPELDEVDDWDILWYIGKYEITLYTCTYRAYSGGKALHETCEMQWLHSFQVAVSYMEQNTCIFFIFITRCIVQDCLLNCSVGIYLFRTLSFGVIIFLCSKTLS